MLLSKLKLNFLNNLTQCLRLKIDSLESKDHLLRLKSLAYRCAHAYCFKSPVTL